MIFYSSPFRQATMPLTNLGYTANPLNDQVK
jgi:hypothetical protein